MHTWQENKAGKPKIAPLSVRLSAIAESLPRGGVICDVGSDHGELVRFLLEKGDCREAIVTDLNIQPLRRAESNLKAAGVSQKAKFILTDGIVDIIPHRPDAYVIAGMGGETIAGILSRAGERIPKGTFFALQPMSRAQLLRRYLYENGFRVDGEYAAYENGKTFLIFTARYDGVVRCRDDAFYLVGEFLPLEKGEGVRTYWQRCLIKTESKIAGKKKAGEGVDKELKEAEIYRKRLEELDENP